MATNSFLKSPFQALIDQQEQFNQMPGSDAVKDVEVPAIEAAPVEKVSQPTPVAAPRQAKPKSLAPPAELRQLFEVSAQEFGVPANVLMAIAQQESSYNNDATNSTTGAAGMAQYMDATAKSLKINARDPNESIPATAMQIAERLAKGMSLDDAIREHFAGPNRKGWGPKTAAYGTDVLSKAEQIANELYGEQVPVEPTSAQVTPDDTPLPNFGVTPEALSKIRNQWNAATPDERVQMESIRGPRGYIAKELNKLQPAQQAAPNPLGLDIDPMAQTREAYKNPALDAIDPRAEARARNLVNQGMEGNTANQVARAAALAGMAPGTEPGIGQRIENTDFDFEARKKYSEDPFFSNPAVRGAVKGYEGYKRGILGLNQFAGEVLGAETLAGISKQGAAESRKDEAAMGDAGSYAQRQFEGAVGSIAQQLPALIGGVATGSEALVLGAMFAQTFGNEYGEGRARGQNEEQAVGRAALYGTFEVIGEKLGLGDALKGLRGAVGGETTRDVATSMARALLKEVPGEQLTTLGQFATDKLPEGYGLNTEAGLAEYLQMAADTAVQTVIQGGIMGGAATGTSAAINRLRGRRAQPEQMPQERIEPTMDAVPAQAGTTEQASPQEFQANDEGFTAQIMGDDGLMHTVDSRTGVTMAEPPAEPKGMLESALAEAAELHANDPAPAPVMPEPEPAPPDYTVMAGDDLRARVKEIAQLSQQDMSQRKQLMPERKAIEKEIAARAKQAKADSKPAEEPLTAGPFEDISAANSMMMRYAEQTGVPHEVVGKEGSFRIQPLQEQDNGIDSAGVGGGAVVGRGNDARERVRDVVPDRVPATSPTDAQPALTDPAMAGTPARNPYQAYSASKPKTAEAYMDKRGIDRSQFEVQQTGPVRWQVVPRTQPVETEVMPNVSERTQVPEEAPVESGAQSAPEAVAEPAAEGAAAGAPAVKAKPAKPKRVEDEKSKAIRIRNERQEAAVKKATEGEAKRKPKQVDSPSFKKWFEDSKVVDDKGVPLVLYHGTRQDFDSFDPSKTGKTDEGYYGDGFYFTAEPDTANFYAGKGSVMPVYLSLQNPYIWPEGREGSTSIHETSALTKELMDAGHDGVIVRNKEMENENSRNFYEVVVFDSKKIKSATGNNGNFDSTNSDVRFSVADELKDSPSAPVTAMMQKLADDGKIVLHDDASSLPFDGKVPAGAQAMTAKDGRIHVVAGSDMAVVLHEAFHSGTQKLIGTAKWNSLMTRLDALYRQSERSSGKAREFFDAARGRVATAKAKGAVADGMAVEEFGAYAIEEYESAPLTVRKWVDDLLGSVKAWALRRFGAQLGQVSPAQLSALSRAALADVVPSVPVAESNPDARFSVAGSPQPRTLTPDEQGLLRRVQAQIQDANNRVKQVQQRIEKVTGVDDLGNADYYQAETNRPGRIAARKENARDKLFEPMMKRLAKAGYKPAQLEELLHAQHAKERNEAVAKINPEHDPADARYIGTQGSGMNDDRADQIIEQYKGERELLAIADEARQIAKDTLALKKEYGLITDQQYDLLDTAYQNYVPLKGDGEYGPKQKRAMGHTERDENILGNIARDYEQAVVVGEKNLARQSLLQMVLQFADDALWTARVPPRGRYVAGTVFEIKRKGSNDVEVSYTSQAQVASFLEGKGTEASQYEVNTSGGERVAEFTKPLQDNEVMVYIKGDPVRIQVYDETLARQLRPLHGEQMNAVLDLMRKHNRYLSMIFTGYNPAFIIKNASRDAITGTINMTGNHGAVTSAKAWAKYPMAWATMLQWAATKKTPNTAMGRTLDEYRAQGGKTGASYMSDLEEQGKNLARMFDDAKGAFSYAKDGRVDKAAWIAARKAIGGLAHTVEVLNQAFENALRLALFAELRAQGKKPGIAAAAAKQVTVNFDRKGVMTPQLGAFYLFINPAIQGTANMSRTLTQGEHKYQAWALTGMMAAAGFAAAVHGMDDDKDRWLGQSWGDRTKNLRFRAGETTINIPMSYEFAPFYAIGVAMGEVARGESSIRAAVRTMSSFLDAYYPMQGAIQPGSDNTGADLLLAHLPTVARVPGQVWMNRNSFGSQVVPETNTTKNRPDNLKMNRGTKNSVYDKTAQAIADAGELVGADKYSNDLTKVSPETLKLIYSTYTGGLGRFVADSAGLAALSTNGDVDLEYADVPILKDFVRSDDIKPIRTRYFDLSDEARKTIDEFAQAKKMGDGEEMRRIAKDPERRMHIALAKMVKSINEVQGTYSDKAVTINADKSLSAADKRAQLKSLEDEQEAIYRKAIRAFQN